MKIPVQGFSLSKGASLLPITLLKNENPHKSLPNFLKSSEQLLRKIVFGYHPQKVTQKLHKKAGGNSIKNINLEH